MAGNPSADWAVMAYEEAVECLRRCAQGQMPVDHISEITEAPDMADVASVIGDAPNLADVEEAIPMFQPIAPLIPPPGPRKTPQPPKLPPPWRLIGKAASSSDPMALPKKRPLKRGSGDIKADSEADAAALPEPSSPPPLPPPRFPPPPPMPSLMLPPPVPPLKRKACERVTTRLTCAADGCERMREADECVHCAVHCADCTCTVHWEFPQRCQTFVPWCLHKHPSPAKSDCRFCRQHCADPDCEYHRVMPKPSATRIVFHGNSWNSLIILELLLMIRFVSHLRDVSFLFRCSKACVDYMRHTGDVDIDGVLIIDRMCGDSCG